MPDDSWDLHIGSITPAELDYSFAENMKREQQQQQDRELGHEHSGRQGGDNTEEQPPPDPLSGA